MTLAHDAAGGNDGSALAVLDTLRAIPSLDPLLGSIAPEFALKIEALLEWFGLPAGTPLFREGDPAADVYIVVRGRLGVFIGEAMTLTGFMGPGDIVGEMGIISGEPRSATVMALRDSEVVRVPPQAIALIMEANPQITIFLMRLLTARLKEQTRLRVLREPLERIAVVSLDTPLRAQALAEPLAAEFERLGHRVAIVDDPEKEPGSLARLAGDPLREIIVYAAGEETRGWGRHCIRQADRVVFVANAAGGAAAASHWALDYIEQLHRTADLVLIEDPASALPSGGTAWLSRFGGERIVHVRAGHAGDLSRLARLVLGRAVCLVLSGGGARGLAHIGVLRAFAEAGIAVDVIAGTSMGAMISGMVALDHPPDRIAAQCRRIFRRKAISDYTVPVIAVMRGRRFSRLLAEIFGDARIENLWRNFFCVSVNLSRGEQYLHKSGLLLEALRASAALPGIMPPIVKDGHILVDGGIMNNLPVGEMSALTRGVVIGVDVTSDWLLTLKNLDADLDIADKSLLWLLSKGRKAGPNILNVLSSAAAVSGGLRTLAGRAEADLLIQPVLGAIDWSAFHEFDRIVELGYIAAVDAIPGIRRQMAALDLGRAASVPGTAAASPAKISADVA